MKKYNLQISIDITESPTGTYFDRQQCYIKDVEFEQMVILIAEFIKMKNLATGRSQNG